MELLINLLTTLNSLTPLAVIALLGLVLFIQARHQKTNSAQMTKIETNDLHNLPDMLETLQRIEVTLNREFSYLRARLDGRDHGSGSS